MEGNKRKKGLLIASLICIGVALALLIPAIILASGEFMFCTIALGGAGVIMLLVYFFQKRAKLVIGILFGALFVIFLICTIAIADMFVWFTAPCFIVGFSLLLDCLDDKLDLQLTFPILAALFSFSFVLFWLLGAIVNSSHISILFSTMTVLFPIVGIILGIVGLLLAKNNEKNHKTCLGLSICAIVFPILVVTVLILLLSTGVFVISLM